MKPKPSEKRLSSRPKKSNTDCAPNSNKNRKKEKLNFNAPSSAFFKRKTFGQKDDALDKKQDQLDNQKRILEAKNKELELFEENLKTANQRIELELERVAGLSKDEAKQNLYDSLIDGVKKDAAQEAKNIEKEAKENAEKLAKNIISLAIQRCAADHATETTVSVVALPNDEMKGRIIGRVGRNIRALESATGVDVIIDDTPDVVTLSGFDPIRREVARLTLEKLIADGRIHPARIEEMVDKVKKRSNNPSKKPAKTQCSNVTFTACIRNSSKFWAGSNTAPATVRTASNTAWKSVTLRV